MRTRIILGVKRPLGNAHNPPPYSALVKTTGSLNFLHRYGPARPVMGDLITVVFSEGIELWCTIGFLFLTGYVFSA
jgi:hypothetical protein